MKPLVSIIVPIYNVEAYLSRCIESLLKQTYDHIEIILVDDGATDTCPQICDEYEKLDNRIKVIHKENGGLSDARNTGVKNSNGDYICFVDSDDFVAERYIERLLEICLKYECDISVCEFCRTSTDVVADVESIEKIDCYTGVNAIDLLYGKDYLKIVVAWNKMYHRNIVLKHEYPKGLVYEDEATTPKYLYEAGKVGVCYEQLYYYYVREGSIVNSEPSVKRLRNQLFVFEERMKFYKDHGLNTYFEKDQLNYMRLIFGQYYDVKKYKLSQEYMRKLKEKYKSTYKNSDKTRWSSKNKVLFGVGYCSITIGLWIYNTYYGLKKYIN